MVSVLLCASTACNAMLYAKWNSHLQTCEFVVIFPVDLAVALLVLLSFYTLVRCVRGMVYGAILLLCY
jgi:hypothetical protein